MSKSLLYHAFGISKVEYVSTKYEKGTVIFKTELSHKGLQCPCCKGMHFHFKGQKNRQFQMVPIGKKKCFLEVKMHRTKCLDCNNLCWPQLPFMSGKRRTTKAFIRYAMDLLKFATIQDVSKHLGVGWDMIKDLHKEHLEKVYKNISLEDIEYLCVDEFSIKKGHEYMTAFSDPKTGAILHAVEGRKKEDIIPFLKKVKKKVLS